MHEFASDTTAPAHPAILKALHDANEGRAGSYGADVWCERARESLCTCVRTLTSTSGSWRRAHPRTRWACHCSVRPQRGAVPRRSTHRTRRARRAEFFTGGGRLSLLPGVHGRIDLDPLLPSASTPIAPTSSTKRRRTSFASPTSPKAAPPTARSTCATAPGPPRGAGLGVHLDGARFANALVPPWRIACRDHLARRRRCHELRRDEKWRRGLRSDPAVRRDAQEARRPEGRAKRAGHMPPKMRFLGAQMAPT